MDPRIKTALTFAEYRSTLNNQIQQIKFKLKSQLLYSKHGGTFEVSPALIGFLEAMKHEKELVVMDINNTPIKIANVHDFLVNIKQVYVTATNKAHCDFERLRRARKVESLVDYINDESN